MKAKILDGEALAARKMQALGARVTACKQNRGRPPLLAVLSIGENPSAKLYTRQQIKACAKMGIETLVRELSEQASQDEAIQALKALSSDASIDGIIIETPLPRQIDQDGLLSELPPKKDVEGWGAFNFGRFYAAKRFKDLESRHIMIPPTAHAIIQLLLESKKKIRGAYAVVIGRSNIAGRPTAHLLSTLDATVTLCHSKTKNLKEYLSRADIVVAAAGKPQFIKGKDLKRGAVVLDAGINYKGKKICGDVDFKSASLQASHITPVPGGVGPVTTAMLLSNTVFAAEIHG